MKKIIALFLILFCISAVGLANNEQQTGLQKSTTKEDNMKKIIFKFCNNGLTGELTDSTSIATQQGIKNNICYIIQNNNDTDVKLTISASDGGTTPEGRKNCTSKKDNVLNFLDGFSDEEVITVPANNYIIKNVDVLFPVGMDGDRHGCIIYSEKKDEITGGGFITKVEYGKVMQFFIGELGDIKNEIKVASNSIQKNSIGDVILNLDLQNVGNLENKISLEGTISNIFGFNRAFNITGETNITPGSMLPLELNLGQIPSYGGLYNVNIDLGLNPFFKYDISNSNINPETIKNKIIKAKLTYFETPRIILGITILIILLLILAFRKPKQKVVYVQQPQQPTPNV